MESVALAWNRGKIYSSDSLQNSEKTYPHGKKYYILPSGKFINKEESTEIWIITQDKFAH